MDHPPELTVRKLLETLAPTYSDFSLHSLHGSYSNFTQLLQIDFPHDPPRKVVVRRYNPANYEEGHDKPACEHHALGMLHKQGIPAAGRGRLDPGTARQRDPDGEMVWHLLNEHWTRRIPLPARFQHTDYWSGNILWQGDEISAVVDWEEAGYGDPAGDVAYCRMEYFLEGLPDAADTFLRVYQAQAGRQLPNLPLFELAASARTHD